MIKAIAAVVLAAALAPAIPAHAATTAGVEFTTVTEFPNDNPWTLGYRFRANNNTTVFGLGSYDSGLDGLTGAHRIGLWDSVGTLLADVTIPAGGGTLLGHFRWADISGVGLTAGQEYVVGSYNVDQTGTDSYAEATGGVVFNPDITFLHDQWLGGSFGFGTSQNSNLPAWFGGNVLFERIPVPEPASLALLGLGIVGLAASRRRRSA